MTEPKPKQVYTNGTAAGSIMQQVRAFVAGEVLRQKLLARARLLNMLKGDGPEDSDG